MQGSGGVLVALLRKVQRVLHPVVVIQHQPIIGRVLIPVLLVLQALPVRLLQMILKES